MEVELSFECIEQGSVMSVASDKRGIRHERDVVDLLY